MPLTLIYEVSDEAVAAIESLTPMTPPLTYLAQVLDTQIAHATNNARDKATMAKAAELSVSLQALTVADVEAIKLVRDAKSSGMDVKSVLAK